jgi:GNAT superfamily N-acetyltransferase
LLVIRIRATDDEEAVHALDRECFTADDAAPIDFARSPEMWIAVDGGVPVGYASASYLREGELHFDRYGVIESGRGVGLGGRLVRTVLAYAKRDGAMFVHTYTHPSNAESINVLVRCGFKAWRPDPFHYCVTDTPELRAAQSRWCYWRRDL